MHIRCPHCHNAIEVVEDATLQDLICPSCGSSFNLLPDETVSRQSPTNRTLGRFTLVERIGIGAFGEVWTAHDSELDRTVAVKIPRKGQLTVEETEAFLREARSAAQLHHANIVAVHEVGKDDETLYIVSDFIKGITLADWLTAKRPTPKEAAELCAKIAAAVQHAHEHGVIHRDLKPSNVMLDEDGEPHIMDFGLAKRDAGEITMTLEGRVLGTPAYMSPEQAKGNAHDADERSDVYSLGVILFELLTGALPFRGSARMLIHQVINEDAPSARKLNSQVPADLETICLKCLEKDPDRRYQTAGDFAADLRRLLAGEPIAARPVSRIQRSLRWCKRNPVVAGLEALVLVTLLTGLVATTSQWLRAKKSAAESKERAASEAVARQAAVMALQSEKDAREQTRRQLYITSMNVAQQAWEEGTLPRLRDLLKSQGEDLRLFEWYFYWRQQSTTNCRNCLELPDSAFCLAFDPHGMQLAVAHTTGPTVSLIDLNKQQGGVQQIGQSTWPQWAHNFVAYSPAGVTLVYPTSDWKRVVLRDTESGSERTLDLTDMSQVAVPRNEKPVLPKSQFQQFAFEGLQVTIATFSPADSTVLAIGDSAGTVRIGNVRTGETFREFHLPCAVHSAAFTHDGTMVGAVSVDGDLRVWELKEGTEIFSQTLNAPYSAMAFSPDGVTLASGGANTIHLVDLYTKETRSTNMFGVHCLAFSPRGKLLAAGGAGRTIHLWKTSDFVEVREMLGHFGSVTSLAFHPTEGMLASTSTDHTVRLWDVNEEQLDHPSDRLDFATSNITMALSPDSTFVAISGSYEPGKVIADAANRLVRIWDCTTLDEQEPLEAEHNIISLAVSSNGLVAAGGGQGNVSIWNHDSGVFERKMNVGEFGITALNFCGDGTMLACGNGKGRLDLWWTNGEGHWSIERAHGGEVQSVAFNAADSKTLATVGSDGYVRLWDARSGQRKDEFVVGRGGGVTRVTFAVDGRTLAVGSQFLGIKLWDLQHRTDEPLIIATPTDSLLYSPDGTTLFTGGNDGLIKVWDTATLQQRCTLKGHNTSVVGLGMTTDGKTLVSCSWDKTVRFWRAASQDEVTAAQW